MSMTAPEYEINTIADFARVPDDRLAQCLREFCTFALRARRNIKLKDIEARLESFTWIDDGIPMVREAHITIGDQIEIIPNPNFPTME